MFAFKCISLLCINGFNYIHLNLKLGGYPVGVLFYHTKWWLNVFYKYFPFTNVLDYCKLIVTKMKLFYKSTRTSLIIINS